MRQPFSLLKITGLTLMLLPLVYSCDSNYDLSKDLNTDINIGSNFSIPAGHTDNIYLSRIIKESDNLTVNNSGQYELAANGDFDSKVKVIDPVKVTGLDPIFKNIDIPIQRANIPDMVLTSDLENITTYNVSTKLPSEVEKFTSATLTSNGVSPVSTKITVSVSNLPKGINEIKLSNITVSLPEILTIKGQSTHIIKSQDIIIDNNQSKGEIPIDIIGVNIPDNLQSKYIKTNSDGSKSLEIKSDLILSAKVEIKASPSQITDNKVTINFQYNVPDVSINNVAGILVPNVKISENLVLSDLPDFVKGEGTHFTPANMGFNVTLKNPINMDLSTSLMITPWNDKTNQSSGKTVTVSIPKIDANKETKFVITNTKKDITAGEINIVQPDLISLLDKIPDSYHITSDKITAKSANESQNIVLGSDYDIKGAYDVSVPFKFKNLEIEYTDSITNLLNDLKDVSDKTKQIEVTAQGLSTIPTELELSVKLYDIAGKELNEIKIDLNKFKFSPSIDGKESESPLQIILTEPEGSNQLEMLEKIVYQVKATKLSTQPDVELKPTQYLKIKNILVKLPKGVTVKI